MNVAIVGAGGIGAVHARHAARVPGVTLFVFDVDASKATGLAARHGAKVLSSLDEGVRECDAAVVGVPTDCHAEVASPWLKAGKAVLVEKPIARTLNEAEGLVQAGGRLAVGQVVRFFCDHKQVHDAVMTGTVGKPATARLRRSGGKPRNWNGWFSDLSRSGGVILDLAVHDLDWLRWTMGEVESVFACSAKANDPELDGDFALTTLKMKEGAVCHSEASWMDSTFRTSIEVSGPKGCIEVDSRINPSFRLDLPGAPPQTFSPMAAADDPYFLQMRAFLSFARGEASDVATGLDGLAALKIALAALQSAQTGETVHLG